MRTYALFIFLIGFIPFFGYSQMNQVIEILDSTSYSQVTGLVEGEDQTIYVATDNQRVIAIDSNENVTWSRQFNITSGLFYNSLSFTNDSCIVFGSTKFVAKLSAAGDVIWLLRPDNIGNIGFMKTLSNGNVVIAGNGVSNNAFVSLIDINGTIVWTRVISKTQLITLSQGLAIDPNDNIVVASHTLGSGARYLVLTRFDVNGNVLVEKSFNEMNDPGYYIEFTDLMAHSDGSFLIVGAFPINAAVSHKRNYVRKFDSNLDLLDGRIYTSGKEDYPYKLMELNNGNTLILTAYRDDNSQISSSGIVVIDNNLDTVITRVHGDNLPFSGVTYSQVHQKGNIFYFGGGGDMFPLFEWPSGLIAKVDENLSSSCTNISMPYTIETSPLPVLDTFQLDYSLASMTSSSSVTHQLAFASLRHVCGTLGIDKEQISSTKTAVKIIDSLGRETKDTPNIPLIYIYSDGTTEKVFRLE